MEFNLTLIKFKNNLKLSVSVEHLSTLENLCYSVTHVCNIN